MMEKSTSGLSVLLAFVGGAVAGATAALLLAPSSGEETRQKLLELASTSKEKVSRMPQALASAYNQAAEVARDAFNEAYEKASEEVGKSLQ